MVIFAVPGAFTPGCSARHLPGFIDNLDKLKEKGVDIIACIASNDPYVMSAWGKAHHVEHNEIVCRKSTFHLAFLPHMYYGIRTNLDTP